ncbi:MAG: type II secretion system protein [Patescibacteria group bacterium]
MEQYTNNSGQLLIELLISITIIGILLTSSLFLITPIEKPVLLSNQKLEAKYLLSLEIENLYALQNQSWSDFLPGQYYLAYTSKNNPPNQIQGWALYPGETTYSVFTEYVDINYAYRVNANTLSSSSTYPQDTNTREATAVVSFTSFGQLYTYQESEYFTNWQQF